MHAQAWSASRRRFKTLNDINSNHFALFHSGSRWLSFLLDFIAAIMTLFVTLFVVLSDNAVISPSLKGLALSYTIQVRHNSGLLQRRHVRSASASGAAGLTACAAALFS